MLLTKDIKKLEQNLIREDKIKNRSDNFDDDIANK